MNKSDEKRKDETNMAALLVRAEIKDHTRLMEAGPLAENEEDLRALIEQAYAHDM